MTSNDATLQWAERNGIDTDEARELTEELIDRVRSAVLPLIRLRDFPELTDAAGTIDLALPVATRLAVTLSADVAKAGAFVAGEEWMCEALDRSATGVRQIFSEEYELNEIVLDLRRALRNHRPSEDENEALAAARPLIEEIIDYFASKRTSPPHDLIDTALAFLEVDAVRDAYVRLAASPQHRHCHTYLAWWRHLGARAVHACGGNGRARRNLPLKREAAEAMHAAGATIGDIAYATGSNRSTILSWLGEDAVDEDD